MIPQRVVFDCNVFLQALSRSGGPAGQCVRLAIAGRVTLLLSSDVLDELRDVLARPKLAAKLKYRIEDAEDFVALMISKAVFIHDVPVRWTLPRDSDDSAYVNLAIAGGASLIVSRDLDLLDLAIEAEPAGEALRVIAPELHVVRPTELLAIIDDRSAD